MVATVADSGGVPTFLLPIGVVIFVTMVKDAYEDVKRHQFDKLENTRYVVFNKTFLVQTTILLLWFYIFVVLIEFMFWCEW